MILPVASCQRNGGVDLKKVEHAMRSYVASAALAAAFVVTPVAAGTTPALSQDFSITNQTESADPNIRDLMRQLQALWEVHAYYPPDASAADQGGTVKLRLVVSPDGNIFMVTVVQSSGSCALDTAGTTTFRDKFVRQFPAGAKELTVDISLHYVLAHRDTPVSKKNFTIANDRVKTTAVEPLLQRVCTGIAMKRGIRNHPAYGYRDNVTAVFFRKPDNTPWVKFTEDGFFGYSPVTEVGTSLMWTGAPSKRIGGVQYFNFYTVWPEGDNRYAGDLASPGQLPPGGYVDLTCGTETVPQMTSIALAEVPKFQPGQQSGKYSVPDGACRK